MEANDITLQDLINRSKQYIVPVFQRYYSWAKLDWETLWSDIKVLTEPENQERTHFMGSLVFFPLTHAFDKYPPYQVIDGQQRLVTFSLIFSVLRYLAIQHSEERLALEIEEDYLVHRFKEGEERFRIYPRQRDRDEYLEAVTNPNLEIEGQIGNAFRFFAAEMTGYIEPAPEEKLHELFDLLRMRLDFVYIQLDGENPYEIFKSLNSKGVPLSQADLIRNFVFMHVKPDEQDEFDDQHWRPLEAHFEHHSGDHEGELDAVLATKFFRDQMMKSGKYVTTNAVFETFESKNGNEFDPVELAVKLHRDADSYDIIRGDQAYPDAAVNASLGKLRKLESSTTYPLLLALLEKAKDGEIRDSQLTKAVESLSGFILRRFATNQSGRTYNRWFVSVCDELGDKPVENLNRFLSEKGFPNDRQFMTDFSTFPWYGGRYVAGVLEALERASEHKEPADLSMATVEHIMPQTLNEAWRKDLGRNAGQIQEEWLHTIGNLTLSAYNPELFNHPFEVKRQEYANSNITLNRNLVQYEKWGKREIKERAAKLAEIASTIWIGPDKVASKAKIGRPPQPITRNEAGYTPTQQLQLDFWTAYMQFLEVYGSQVNTRKPYPQTWADFAIGRWEFWLGNSIHIADNRTKVHLGLQGPDVKSHFHNLLADKDDIESELGTSLDWQERLDRKQWFISLSTNEFDTEKRDQWPRQHAWMHRWLEAFYNCFHPRVQAMRDQSGIQTTAVSGHGPDGITPTRALQLEYWTAFKEYLEAEDSSIKARKPQAQQWANFAIGRWEFELGSSIHMEKQRTNVDLCIYGPNAKRHYHLLHDNKDTIEAELGSSVSWKEMPEKKSSYVTLSTYDFDPADRDSWPTQHAWMHRWLEAFYNCFHPRTEAMRNL